MKKTLLAAAALILCLNSCAALREPSKPAPDTTTNTQSAVTDPADKTEDGITGKVVFSDNKADISGKGLSFADSVLTVSQSGTYELYGKLNGKIVVRGSQTDRIRLILCGVTVVCKDDAPISVLSADRVTITLAPETENEAADGATRQDAAHNAAIWSKSDLTIDGSGTLHVTAHYNNGIDSSDDLRIVSGNIRVSAPNNALKANDSFAMEGGNLNLQSQDDGIKVTNLTNPEKGFLRVTGGNLSVTAKDDALQATTEITVKSPAVLRLNAGGKITNCEKNNISVEDGCIVR